MHTNEQGPMSSGYISQQTTLGTASTPLTQRVSIQRPGGLSQLKIERRPTPKPGPHQILIAVRAAGVNFADTIVRMGLYASAKEFVQGPITPGFEVAGVVAAVGPGVSKFSVGDEVFALTLFNGYASDVVVSEDYVYAKPASQSFDEAAAIPTIFLTAWYALHELAHPRPGAKVLVHSAAGGVGGAIVQLGKIAKCEVVAVVGRSQKVQAAKDFGADHVIDKSTQDLWQRAEALVPDGFDLILDANGVSTLGESYKHLRRSGKLVVYGFHSMLHKFHGHTNWPRMAADYLRTPRFNPLDMTNDSKSVLAFNLSYLFERLDIAQEAMAQISGWLARGEIHAPPLSTYPLSDVALAHADIESGRTIGKLILNPN